MLSPAERTGLENLLDELNNEDLFNLFDTVTKRLISRSNNRNEVIAGLLSCVQKPTDILNRQRITKKVLYNYLWKLCGSISPESNKLELVTKCLNEWKSTDLSQSMDCWDEENEAPEKVPEPKTEQNSLSEQVFGIRFVEWFFPLFNRVQDFGVQHFWQDAVLKVSLVSPVENQILAYGNNSDCVAFLTNLVAYYKFCFLPNNSSVQYIQEAHGLIKVFVSGTVHQQNNPIGLFDFMFGLVRNPEYENNYKIKHVLLNLKMTVAFQNLLPST